jgi:hypothetical protein
LKYGLKPQDILHFNWISQTYGEAVHEYWKTEGIYEKDIKLVPGAMEFVLILKQMYGENNIFIMNSAD